MLPGLLVLLVLAGAPPAAGAEGASPAPLRFQHLRYPTGGRNPFGVAAADLDGDHRLDLAVTHVGSSSVTVLRADSANGFVPTGPAVTVGKIPRGITAADLDADGHTDLVVAGGVANTVEVLLGNGAGHFQKRTLRARIAPFDVAVADLNADGNLDIAVANESNVEALHERGELSIFFGDGRGAFSQGPVLLAGTYPADIEAADLNGDGKTDLAAVCWGSGDVAAFLGRGAGSFSSAIRFRHGGANSYTLAVGDLDGDGDPDIATGDTLGIVRIARNDGRGRFATAATANGGRGLRSLVIADIDEDGRNDVVTANAAADTVSVLLGAPGGTFAEPLHVAVGRHPRNVLVSDMNGDGRLDIVATNLEDDDVSVLLNVGSDD